MHLRQQPDDKGANVSFCPLCRPSVGEIVAHCFKWPEIRAAAQHLSWRRTAVQGPVMQSNNGRATCSAPVYPLSQQSRPHFPVGNQQLADLLCPRFGDGIGQVHSLDMEPGKQFPHFGPIVQ